MPLILWPRADKFDMPSYATYMQILELESLVTFGSHFKKWWINFLPAGSLSKRPFTPDKPNQLQFRTKQEKVYVLRKCQHWRFPPLSILRRLVSLNWIFVNLQILLLCYQPSFRIQCNCQQNMHYYIWTQNHTWLHTVHTVCSNIAHCVCTAK
jgi:hypothetical protein